MWLLGAKRRTITQIKPTPGEKAYGFLALRRLSAAPLCDGRLTIYSLLKKEEYQKEANMRYLIILFVFFFCHISPAIAESKAAAYLVKKEIAEACDGEDGSIKKSAIIEHDLTGDGKNDLIISHEGIACASGGRSGFCGAQVCSFKIYVREGELLKLKEEMLGSDVRVSSEANPTIHWHAHGGSAQKFRWNGKDFR
ncbi:MAG TPA: hypothetical protein P5260_01140 [Candidatus Competibacter sp.]|jgi:hypothetical protein|nr:hypothetical protein [Candidatus Competibacter sp.]